MIFFVSSFGWETMTKDFWGEVSWLLQKWEIPSLGAPFWTLKKKKKKKNLRQPLFHICNSSFDTYFVASEHSTWRAIIRAELKPLWSLLAGLMTLTILWILIACMIAVLDLALLNMCWEKYIEKRKIRISSFLWSPFSFYFCFLSLSLVLFTPPTTRSKGKSKVGKSV